MKGGIYMNITEYINNHEVLSQFPFMIVYCVIATLVQEGYILQNVDKI